MQQRIKIALISLALLGITLFGLVSCNIFGFASKLEPAPQKRNRMNNADTYYQLGDYEKAAEIYYSIYTDPTDRNASKNSEARWKYVKSLLQINRDTVLYRALVYQSSRSTADELNIFINDSLLQFRSVFLSIIDALDDIIEGQCDGKIASDNLDVLLNYSFALTYSSLFNILDSNKNSIMDPNGKNGDYFAFTAISGSNTNTTHTGFKMNYNAILANDNIHINSDEELFSLLSGWQTNSSSSTITEMDTIIEVYTSIDNGMEGLINFIDSVVMVDLNSMLVQLNRIINKIDDLPNMHETNAQHLRDIVIELNYAALNYYNSMIAYYNYFHEFAVNAETLIAPFEFAYEYYTNYIGTTNTSWDNFNTEMFTNQAFFTQLSNTYWNIGITNITNYITYVSNFVTNASTMGELGSGGGPGPGEGLFDSFTFVSDMFNRKLFFWQHWNK